jgi:flagellar hook-associated protein FlgK|tara:strand:+ start:683 stop:952 length:270 start_codon:yes stop_codon:yes gene_type:complete
MGTYIVDIESIDRLANKVKELVEVLERTKNELSEQVEDNARLTKAIEDLQSQISASKSEHVEVTNLLDEREQIRNRVTTILEQLEQINF